MLLIIYEPQAQHSARSLQALISSYAPVKFDFPHFRAGSKNSVLKAFVMELWQPTMNRSPIWKFLLRPFVLILFGLLAVPAAAQSVYDEPVTLSVMTFNIWLGGDTVDFGKVVEAVQRAGADIV